MVLTHMEHHANIVPWQMMATERGIEIRWIPLTDDGRLDLSDLDNIIDGASVVSFTAMSNVLGTMNPVREIVDRSHAAGATVMVDACQSVPHAVTDVQAMGADLIAFSDTKCSDHQESACCGADQTSSINFLLSWGEAT